jgi:hypothetical protein
MYFRLFVMLFQVAPALCAHGCWQSAGFLENLDKLKTKLEFSEKAGKKVLEVGSSCLPVQLELEHALASVWIRSAGSIL